MSEGDRCTATSSVTSNSSRVVNKERHRFPPDSRPEIPCDRTMTPPPCPPMNSSAIFGEAALTNNRTWPNKGTHIPSRREAPRVNSTIPISPRARPRTRTTARGPTVLHRWRAPTPDLRQAAECPRTVATHPGGCRSPGGSGCPLAIRRGAHPLHPAPSRCSPWSVSITPRGGARGCAVHGRRPGRKGCSPWWPRAAGEPAQDDLSSVAGRAGGA
jgi:hypothetical protein